MATIPFKSQAKSDRRFLCSICHCQLPSDSDKALEAHNRGRRHLAVAQQKARREELARRSVYVRGFHPGLAVEEELRENLSRFGPIKSVYIDETKRVYAIVEFTEASSAQQAVSASPLDCGKGFRLVIKWRDSKPQPIREQTCPVQSACKKRTGLFLSEEILNSLAAVEELESQMCILGNLLQLSEDELCLRRALRDILQACFKEILPDCLVEVFGSSANGFGLTGCDVDMTLLSDCASNMVQVLGLSSEEGCSQSVPPDLWAIAHVVRYIIPDTSQVIPIPAGHCPVVKFRHSSGLQCDLSINNRLALNNSQLLGCYAASDPRVRLLVVTVTSWARQHGLRGHASHQLNTYSWTLTVVHYLQQRDPPLLPCLQQPVPVSLDNGTGPDPARQLLQGWDCSYFPRTGWRPLHTEIDPGLLLLGYFRFYSDFDFKTLTVHIHKGNSVLLSKRNIDRSLMSMAKLTRSWTEYPICIQDPFELSHNTAGNVTAEGLARIVKSIQSALSLLVCGKSLPDLLFMDRTNGGTAVGEHVSPSFCFEVRSQSCGGGPCLRGKFIHSILGILDTQFHMMLSSFKVICRSSEGSACPVPISQTVLSFQELSAFLLTEDTASRLVSVSFGSYCRDYAWYHRRKKRRLDQNVSPASPQNHQPDEEGVDQKLQCGEAILTPAASSSFSVMVLPCIHIPLSQGSHPEPSKPPRGMDQTRSDDPSSVMSVEISLELRPPEQTQMKISVHEVLHGNRQKFELFCALFKKTVIGLGRR